MAKQRFHERLVAITDIETTGLDPFKHDIIDLGSVLVDHSMQVVDELELKIKPTFYHPPEKKALQINGYNEAEWQDAIDIKSALTEYSDFARDAIFAAYNVTFDWSFVSAAFKKYKTENTMSYHRVDIMSMFALKVMIATAIGEDDIPEGVSLKNACERLGVEPEPDIHRAMNGAKTAYAVLKTLHQEGFDD